MEEAVALVDTFLRSGQSVCPFATTGVLHYVEVGAHPRFGRRSILRCVREFSTSLGQKPSHALVVIGEPGTDYATIKEWARRAFLELYISFAIDSGEAVEDAEQLVEQVIRPLLIDDTDPRRPRLVSRDQAPYAICMAPVYSASHPRYAPRPIIVVTWESDVTRAHAASPGVVRGIRDRMKREQGCVYDADELMLPLPTPIVRELINGLEPATGEKPSAVATAWDDAISRRISELKQGAAKTQPAAVVHVRIRQQLRARARRRPSR